MITIGRGLREFIIGDRQTGKTAVATYTLINHKGHKKVIWVYVVNWSKSILCGSGSDYFTGNMGAMEYTFYCGSRNETGPRYTFLYN